jgi:hypothetical protein
MLGGSLPLKEPKENSEEEIKVLQNVKIICRSVYCALCPPKERSLAAYYCPCTSFLCVPHFVNHKCILVLESRRDEAMLEALK